MFVHGMLGAGKNWRSFSGNLMRAAQAAGRANWGMVLVDLRNHGRSSRTAGLEGPHTLEAAAGDLIDLCEAEFGGKTPDLIVGHSLGGKVVLEYLRTLRQRGGLQLPEAAWVLDSVPNRVPPGPTTREIEHVLKAVRPLYDAPVPSRKWLHETLSAQGFSEAFIGWLGSSLERDPANKAFYWNFDLDGVAEMFRSYCDSDYLADLAAPPAGTEVNLVVAERSDRWTFETLEALEGLAATTPNFHLRHLADAGHWLHVDNPAGLLGMVRSAVE